MSFKNWYEDIERWSRNKTKYEVAKTAWFAAISHCAKKVGEKHEKEFSDFIHGNRDSDIIDLEMRVSSLENKGE